MYGILRPSRESTKKEEKTMTIERAMKEYRLAGLSTPEDLECRWSKVLTFGDKVLVAGHYYNGVGQPSYFGAVYLFLDDDHSCEGEVTLEEVSEVEFYDDGHAIAWALQQ